MRRDDRQPTSDGAGTLSPATRLLLAAAPVLLFAWIAVATAWLSDDSLISLRQVWHFINGYGFTWNYGQRVQAFTHPAWVLLLSAVTAVTRELFYTTIIVSVVLSVASVPLVSAYARLQRRSCAPAFVVGFVVALAFSKAFTDYMTSGLETPLSFFLVGLVLWRVAAIERRGADARSLALVFVLLALAFLNRFDLALLLLPLALYLLVRHVGTERLRVLAPGVAIIVAWFVFAVVYFGSPMPNSYYAKLVAGYPSAEVHARGVAYFVVSWGEDPVTAALIVFGVLAGVIARGWVTRTLSVGIALYCVYVWSVGGDFMQGRFFAVPAYAAVLSLVALDGERMPARALRAAALGAVIGLAMWGPKPLLSGTTYSNLERVSGIGDARGFWYRRFGLLSPERSWPPVPRPPTQRALRHTPGCSGEDGFVREDVYLIDVCALTDPLLARLPAIRSPDWRIGHHYRKIPTDYGNVAVRRAPRLADAALQPLFDDVRRATTGPLFTRQRWGAIMRLAFPGGYDFDRERYADPTLYLPRSSLPLRVSHRALDRAAPPDGTVWLRDQPQGMYGEFQDVATVFDAEMLVLVQPSRAARRISISLDADDAYRVTVNQDDLAFDIDRAAPGAASGRLVTHVIELPQVMPVAMIRIEAVAGDGVHAVGHVRLLDDG